MTDYEFIQSKIQEGMYQTHMHTCLRDIGALAGGFLAAGRLSPAECDSLCEYAKSLAINKAEAERKWKSAVVYGTRSPVHEQDYRHINIGAFFDSLNLNSVVDDTEYKVVDEAWLEVEHIDQPDDDWNPCAELKEYLSLLFQPDDFVGYCIQPFERDGRWLPDRGVYTQKAGDIIKALSKKSKDAFEKAVGTLNNEKSGAWIRFNPLDGNGVADVNVTEYRYALVESDGMDIEKQVAIYRKLELPCVCIVHSGGKSAHAIVRVFASSLEEYRKRVDFLYEVCANNGLPVDKQNRNPSRYSRMPGVLRDGRKQYIICRSCGKATWDEWETWIKDLNDNLPDFESLASLDISRPPALKPVVIDGVLREGFKMRIQGPSKAGKSFALIELAVAMAEGVEWFGHKCRPGRVLYINLELDRASALNRFASGGSFHAILQNNTASVGIGKYKDKSLKALSKDLQEAVNKGSNILVVPGDGKLTPYTMTSADLQFLESRKLTVRDIARFFNVPAALLMDDSGSNYNTMEQANIAFYSQALRPILCDIVGEITGKRLTERTAYEVKYTHDVSGIYTTDLKSRIDYEKGLLETGQATVNDLRRRNDTSPVEGGDTVYMSVQVQPLNQPQQEQPKEGGES